MDCSRSSASVLLDHTWAMFYHSGPKIGPVESEIRRDRVERALGLNGSNYARVERIQSFVNRMPGKRKRRHTEESGDDDFSAVRVQIFIEEEATCELAFVRQSRLVLARGSKSSFLCVLEALYGDSFFSCQFSSYDLAIALSKLTPCHERTLTLVFKVPVAADLDTLSVTVPPDSLKSFSESLKRDRKTVLEGLQEFCHAEFGIKAHKFPLTKITSADLTLVSDGRCRLASETTAKVGLQVLVETVADMCSGNAANLVET